jgi:acetylglutamate kinase
MRVLKVGGNELKKEQFLSGLAAAIAKMDESVVIVHGGGQAIADMQMALGLPIEKVDGLRVTSEAAMNVTEMVLSGHTNKLLVRALLAADVNAIGLSGVDGGLLMARKKVHDSADLGYVGTVMSVNTLILELLLAEGFTPVVSPVSLGLDNHAYNVNADEAATAIAAALEADQLDFISNVPGVLQDNVLVHQLTNKQTNKLITEGVIFGGMLPKVRAALNSVEQGVTQVRIVNLAGLNTDSGTLFRVEE